MLVLILPAESADFYCYSPLCDFNQPFPFSANFELFHLHRTHPQPFLPIVLSQHLTPPPSPPSTRTKEQCQGGGWVEGWKWKGGGGEVLNGCEQPAQSQAPLGQMEAGLGADVSRPGSRGLGETPVKRRRCNHSAIVANSWTSEVAANGPPDQGATQITPFKHDPVPRWWKVTLGERRPWRGKVRRE